MGFCSTTDGGFGVRPDFVPGPGASRALASFPGLVSLLVGGSGGLPPEYLEEIYGVLVAAVVWALSPARGEVGKTRQRFSWPGGNRPPLVPSLGRFSPGWLPLPLAWCEWTNLDTPRGQERRQLSNATETSKACKTWRRTATTQSARDEVGRSRMDWKPTKIRWVNDTLATSTGASRVETDWGPAYAKFVGNPGGLQALFCELVGTRAATWLGLPTLQYALVDVAEPELVTYIDGTKSEAGPAFVSRLEDGTPWGGSADELRYVENIDVLAGLIVLDTWLLNCDRYRFHDGRERRNVRNLFLTARGAPKGKFRALAMDHTHCFTCGRELTPRISNLASIRSTQVLGDFPEFRGYVSRGEVARFADRLSRFEKSAAETLLASIPKSWGISAEVGSSVVEFLSQRAGFVSQNVVRQLSERGYFEPELDFGRND